MSRDYLKSNSLARWKRKWNWEMVLHRAAGQQCSRGYKEGKVNNKDTELFWIIKMYDEAPTAFKLDLSLSPYHCVSYIYGGAENMFITFLVLWQT